MSGRQERNWRKLWLFQSVHSQKWIGYSTWRVTAINLDEQTMNSKKVKLTAMIIRLFHQKAIHERRNVTLNELRASEYWVI